MRPIAHTPLYFHVQKEDGTATELTPEELKAQNVALKKRVRSVERKWAGEQLVCGQVGVVVPHGLSATTHITHDICPWGVFTAERTVFHSFVAERLPPPDESHENADLSAEELRERWDYHMLKLHHAQPGAGSAGGGAGGAAGAGASTVSATTCSFNKHH